MNEMQRRREAALRLPPLPDGRHDPETERRREKESCTRCGSSDWRITNRGKNRPVINCAHCGARFGVAVAC